MLSVSSDWQDHQFGKERVAEGSRNKILMMVMLTNDDYDDYDDDENG